ncbi:MAG: hypothetical protein ACRDJV_08060 [Actinomycetota bacterium]
MTTRVWRAVGALAIVVAIAGSALASSDHSSGAKRLKLLDVSDKFEFVDVGRPAEGEGDLSPGDMLIFENILRNRADTKTLGTFVAICTMAVPPMTHCRGTLWLEDGKIELSAAVNLADAETIHSAVTGGTSSYRRARGHAIFGEEVAEGVRELTVVLLP